MPKSRKLRFGQVRVQFNWFIALCVLLSCAMFINLALWQLERAADKRAQASQWQTLQSAEPVPFQDLLARSEVDMALANHTAVQLRGWYEPSPVAFLLLYQFWQGRPGYELVSPFRLADGSGHVLVSRGWIAAPESGGLPVIPDVQGQQEVVARLHVPELSVRPGEVSDESWPLRLPRLHIEQAAALLGESLFPYVLRLESDQPGVQARHWSAPDFSARMHYGYAFQWFMFTVATLILTVLLSSNALTLLRQRSAAGRRPSD